MFLFKQNISWKDEAIILRKTTTLLAIIAALGGVGNIRTAYKLSQEQKKNAALTTNYNNVRSMAKDTLAEVIHLRTENEVLHDYAGTAQAFALGLMPTWSENDHSCEKPNCPDCKATDEANRIALKNYNTAMKVLGVNPQTLATLRQGPQYK